MATKIVSRAFLLLDGTEFECKSITLGGDMSPDVVKVMNRRNRAAGHRDGIPEFNLTAEIPLPEGGHAVDFMAHMLAGTEFTSVIEYQDGQSESYYDCKIGKVERNPSAGEEIMTTIEMQALDYGRN